MGVPLFEQETVINIMRDEDVAHICTSDSTMITKLEHRCESNPDEWKKVDENPEYKFYECPKNFISFRSKKVTRELTDEQRAEISERMRRISKNNATDPIS